MRHWFLVLIGLCIASWVFVIGLGYGGYKLWEML